MGRLPRLRIAPSFYLFLSLVLALKLERGVGAVFFLISLHESAHLLAILVFHGRAKELIITPFGLRMTSRGGLTKAEEAIALFMGPLSNLLAAWALFLLAERSLAAESFALGVYNLLPAKGLDGGRLLALLYEEKGERIASACSIMLAALFMAAAFYLALNKENFLSPLLASWLMILT